MAGCFFIFLCKVLFMRISKLYQIFLSSTGVCTDTRKITDGSLFIALKGEHFDGNQFVKQAFNSGAAYALVDNKEAVINENCFLVENSMVALQQLANYHRKRFFFPVIALTGSNGKTTTKELLVAILKQKYNVLYTQGNFNNHIGVPLTLLKLKAEHDIAVIEMGANHQGEIKALCEIAEPDYGLITNIGRAHLEGFGGIQGVIKGKTELYRFIKDSGRLLFVNEQDELLTKHSEGISRVFYGPQKNQLKLSQKTPLLWLQWKQQNIQTQMTGAYNAQNIQAALGIGLYFRVEVDDIIAALESYSPDNSRSQIIHAGTNVIILDAYNANPTSVKVAVENLKAYESKHSSKMIALGDMLELGDESLVFHQQIYDFVKAQDFDKTIFVGQEFKNVVAQHGEHIFDTSSQAAAYLASAPPEDAVVLIKGSRGIRMETLLKAVTSQHKDLSI